MMPQILVVDDDLLTRTTLTLILEDAGYVVQTATDGAEAYELIGRSPPDLLISDIRLPHLSGVELRTLLRSRAQTQKLPILLTSASVRPVLGADACCTFLEKPVDIDLLLSVVAQLLNSARPHERSVGISAYVPGTAS